MAEYQAKFDGGICTSRTMTGTVTGGQLITTAGVTAGANATDWLGVVGYDGVSGDLRPVFRGSVQRLTASAAIAAGAKVKCAAAGKIVTHVSGTDAPERLVGTALEAATADGDVIAVQMER
jgi:hypothetical protein